MDSFSAFARGEANRHEERKVFDWNKAARLIKEKQPRVASAGLCNDWEYTGDTIYNNSNPVLDTYTYLASTWATPEINLDGDVEGCYLMESETEWNESTKWPESALDILNSTKEMGYK